MARHSRARHLIFVVELGMLLLDRSKDARCRRGAGGGRLPTTVCCLEPEAAEAGVSTRNSRASWFACCRTSRCRTHLWRCCAAGRRCRSALASAPTWRLGVEKMRDRRRRDELRRLRERRFRGRRCSCRSCGYRCRLCRALRQGGGGPEPPHPRELLMGPAAASGVQAGDEVPLEGSPGDLLVLPRLEAAAAALPLRPTGRGVPRHFLLLLLLLAAGAPLLAYGVPDGLRGAPCRCGRRFCRLLLMAYAKLGALGCRKAWRRTAGGRTRPWRGARPADDPPKGK